MLLIAAFLDEETLKSLYNEVISIAFTPLVEVHNYKELKTALAIGGKPDWRE